MHADLENQRDEVKRENCPSQLRGEEEAAEATHRGPGCTRKDSVVTASGQVPCFSRNGGLWGVGLRVEPE